MELKPCVPEYSLGDLQGCRQSRDPGPRPAASAQSDERGRRLDPQELLTSPDRALA